MQAITALIIFFMVSIPALHAQPPDDATQELIARYQAIDFSDDFMPLIRNPWEFQGHHVYVKGAYSRHIGPTRFVLRDIFSQVAVDFDVQLIGGPFFGCVGEVMGTVRIDPYQENFLLHTDGGEVPHIQALECLTISSPFSGRSMAEEQDQPATEEQGPNSESPKMSDTVKQLMEALKSTTRTTAASAPTTKPTPRRSP